MEGEVDGADFYFLCFDTAVTKKYSNALWLENKRLTLQGDLSSIKELRLSGSPSQRVYEAWMKISDSIINRGNLTSLVQFTKAYSTSFFAPYAINTLRQLADSREVLELYTHLEPHIQSSYWGKQLGKNIKTDSISKLIQIGNTLLDFKVTDLKGEEVSILQLAKANKYTLLDFWASWCSPCRKAIPGMKQVYQDFAKKGFGIVGVSTDKKIEHWKKAVGEENVPWIQTLDNVDAAGQNIFSLSAIPAYILLDQEGKIVKKMMFTANNALNTNNEKLLSENLHAVISQLLP